MKDFAGIDVNGDPVSLKGNDDILVLTKSEIPEDIHGEYVEEGPIPSRQTPSMAYPCLRARTTCRAIVHELNKLGAQLASDRLHQMC